MCIIDFVTDIDTRERILRAAARLLAESGGAPVSTRAVCAAAGVGAPTLYHHFGDKEGLLDAVVTYGFERYLARNGTVVRKFFLHVSKEEQRRRLLERLDDPAKNWKFDAADLSERDRWDDYMRAYQRALSKTSTRHAPWFVVPADHKWFTRVVVAQLVIETLESLDLKFPPLSKSHLDALAEARARLEAEQ